jgi:hypothetical protein
MEKDTLKALDMSDYEKILEDENSKLRNEIEFLRTTISNIGPKMDAVLFDILSEVEKLNNGYYEKATAYTIIVKKIRKERDTIKKNMTSL